jgi:hypothetical protein
VGEGKHTVCPRPACGGGGSRSETEGDFVSSIAKEERDTPSDPPKKAGGPPPPLCGGRTSDAERAFLAPTRIMPPSQDVLSDKVSF